MGNKPTVGQHVVFVDELRQPHDALITNVFSEVCVNILFITKDDAKTDPYGNQTERKTSVPHGKTFGFEFGNYWKFAGE